jgi:predicted kinase
MRRPGRLDNSQMISALVLVGAPGSGKSAVLDALATRLEIDGVAHGALESEELSRGFRPLPAGSWTDQLAAVLRLQRDAGRRLFLIAATTEDDEQLRRVVSAAEAEALLTVCLDAPADVLAERLQRREPDEWPGKQPLIAHARALASAIPRLAGIDRVIDTSGRKAEQVALEVYAQMRLGGLCGVTG